ncbi:LOW QUALITY PROTEIN: hypothetical protein HID58_082284, partial [Brassica napus]
RTLLACKVQFTQNPNANRFQTIPMANSYTLLADLRAGRCSNTAEIVYESMMKLSVEKLHITCLQKVYGALEDSIAVGLPGIALLGIEHTRSFSKSGINVIIGRAFGKSLRCNFQGDNNPGYDIPGACMLITLLYGSCAGDDNNHEYDIPGAGPVSLKPLKNWSKILPPLGWLLLEIQKDQQPLTMSSMLNLCMVHYQKATQCLASKLRNGQDQS